MEDLTAVPDSGLGWLEASGDHADMVLSTRVRLARNLQGYAFGPRARVNDREAVLAQVRAAKAQLVPLSGSTVVNLPSAREPLPPDPAGEAPHFAGALGRQHLRA